MAGKLTLWGAGEILTSFFSKTAEPPPAFYLAAIKDIAPTPYISGSELDEPDSDAGYERVEIFNDSVTWTNEGQIQVMTCEIDCEFLTATEDWGAIRYWALCNAPVEGYCYFVGDFDAPAVIYTSDQLVVESGDLSVSLGPFFFAEQ